MESFKMLQPIIKCTRYVHKLPRHNCSSITCVSKNYSTQHSDAKEILLKEKLHLRKPVVTKWKRPPFLKDYFFGKFDTELCAWPEILDKEHLTEVEDLVKIINNLYTEKVNSVGIDDNRQIPDNVLQELKDLGLFGRMIPEKYGGLDLSHTACVRLNEALGLDWSIFSTLAAHEFLASQVVLQYGSEEQKSKYLPLFASGKSIVALCNSEMKCGSDMLIMMTRADVMSDGSFVLNGSKSWVTNAELADTFIVFAKTINDNHEDISAFIVEKCEGITVTPQETTSLHGVKIATVTFKEVQVPASNLVGKSGEGIKIHLKALEAFRMCMSSFTFGTLKLLLDSITEYVIDTERSTRALGDIQVVRERLSKINTMIYAMESVAYFTAALADSTENPDLEVEAAAAKIFCSEGTLYCIRELMTTLGSASLLKDRQLERFHRDAQALDMFETPNDIVRLFIGLTGCKVVGAKKADDVLKVRNPFFFPKEALQFSIKRNKVLRGIIKYDQDLAGHLHPSLVAEGNALEACLQKFHVATLHLLDMHGKKVVDTQLDPKKLANVVIELYAMSAVLARSSRSYCIGLKNAHHEIQVASAFCNTAKMRIDENLGSIFQTIYQNNDGTNLILGEQVIDCRGYFPEHPLKHNF